MKNKKKLKRKRFDQYWNLCSDLLCDYDSSCNAGIYTDHDACFYV